MFYLAIHSSNTNTYSKKQKSLQIMASMALTNLEKKAHRKHESVPGMTLPIHASL
jgi:hypothetical protein